MYNVVIIDDNPLFVESVSIALNWNALSCEIAGTAENGLDGKALIEHVKPDIIITDISMPGIDGLEMIKQVRGLFPDCKIIIVTGFDRFEYAQRALYLHVDEFLLKPVACNVLMRAVKTVVKSLDNRAEARPDTEAGNKPVVKTFSLLIQAFMVYAEENACKEISLSSAAEDLRVSPNYLSALIKKETGLTYTDIVTHVRLETAKRLLRKPQYRIEEIGELAGYKDYISFYKVFKRKEGMSPKSYRQRIDGFDIV